LLPVGLKLYKDKDELNFQDISLWSNISIFVTHRWMNFSHSLDESDPIDREKPVSTALAKEAKDCPSQYSVYKLVGYVRFESERYVCLRGKPLVDCEGLFFLQDMTHSLKLSEQQALLGAKNVQGGHGHYESPYYSGSRMLDVPVSSSDIDTTSSVGVFRSRSVVQQPDNSPYVEGLPIWRAALLVVNSALGAGILNFPQAYAECGGIATAITIQMVGVSLLSD